MAAPSGAMSDKEVVFRLKKSQQLALYWIQAKGKVNCRELGSVKWFSPDGVKRPPT